MKKSSVQRLVAVAAAGALALTIGSGSAFAAVTMVPPGRVAALGTTSVNGDGTILHDALAAQLVYPSGQTVTVTYAPVKTDGAYMMSSAPGATDDDLPVLSTMDPNLFWGDSSTDGEYTPENVNAGDGVNIYNGAPSSCTVTYDAAATCANTGTLTFDFSQAATDAILHIANLCATSDFSAAGSSAAFNLDLASSTYTSATVSMERVSGTPGLVLDGTRVEAPSNPTGIYDLNQCGYGSVRVLGTYTKIVLTIDLDYYVDGTEASGAGATDDDIRNVVILDALTVTWSLFDGTDDSSTTTDPTTRPTTLPATGSNGTLLVISLMTVLAGGLVLGATRRTLR